MSCRAKKTHPGVLELVRTLQSIIWDTEVRTFPRARGLGPPTALATVVRDATRKCGGLGRRITRLSAGDGGYPADDGYGQYERLPGPGTAGIRASRTASTVTRKGSSGLRRLRARARPGRRLRRPAGVPARRIRARPIRWLPRPGAAAAGLRTSAPTPAATAPAAATRTLMPAAMAGPAVTRRLQPRDTQHHAGAVAAPILRCPAGGSGGSAAIRSRTRATTGTAASRPPRRAAASRTPARTRSTGESSTSTAPARAERCATRRAVTRLAAARGAARCPLPGQRPACFRAQAVQCLLPGAAARCPLPGALTPTAPPTSSRANPSVAATRQQARLGRGNASDPGRERRLPVRRAVIQEGRKRQLPWTRQRRLSARRRPRHVRGQWRLQRLPGRFRRPRRGRRSLPGPF